ncbi:MAG TPA: flagellar basal-body MS-ring/collar protein FliF [Kineosporiaceae bacterium]|nr:flagellar basal-body MS-ring/collar protein FliF [Kineosporiaceae bacterium]
MAGRLTQTLGRARSLLKGFTPGQRGVIVVAAIALVFGAFLLTRWAAQPTWTPLYTNLSGSDANAIVEQLRADNVQYQLADGGATVLVPQAQVYDLRVSLAGKGLPNTGNNGYSVLDSQGMTATDLQQNVAYQRALESELGKTLQSINGVQTAIVHLAIPKKSVFSSEQDKTTASVLLALAQGTTLDRNQVRAVTHLVASSIPGLDPAQVTVTDAKGNLLSTQGIGGDGAPGQAGDADQQTAQVEDRMSRTVQQMLDKVLGPGHAVARVNAQLNYDTRATTSERFLSETGVPPLSEATTTETYSGAGAGAGGNLGGTWPTLTPGVGAAGGGSYARSQKTADNAIGKVVESAQAAPGSIERLTVAVVMDSTTTGKTDPNTVQQMVANAVGLDPKRGDSVTVSSLPFDTSAATAAAKEVKAAASAAQTAQYLDLAKKAGLVLAAIVVGVILLRRRGRGASVQAYASDLPDQALVLPGAVQPALGAGPASGQFALPGHELPALDLEAEQAMNRERLRDEVARMVDNQPEEVAQVIQGWLSQRKG